MPFPGPQAHTLQKGSEDSTSIVGLLEKPVVAVTSTHPTGVILRRPLLASYLMFFILTTAYSALSGYASLWNTSFYFGAVAGLNSALFSGVLLITTFTSSRLHPLARPPSATSGPAVYCTSISVCWAITTGLTIKTLVTSQTLVMLQWVSVELGLAIACFASAVSVMILQQMQASRYDVAINNRLRSVWNPYKAVTGC